MSALAAYLSFNHEPPEAWLERLLAAQARRGPHAQSQARDGAMALGVRHLHRSVKHARQDHRCDYQLADCLLAWDGRLDNRSELVAALGSPVLAEQGDGAILIHAYRRWGTRCLQRLLGDFVFCLWDARSRELFCARDPLGARPFYYTWQPGFFAAASEDEALLELPGMSRALHPDRAFYRDNGGFWAFDWQNAWPRDVFILMPGSALIVTVERRLRRWRYFDWGSAPAPFKGDRREVAVAFGEVFRQAVRDRLRDQDEIGVIASGGIDSLSVLTAAYLEREGRKLHQFSTVHDQADGDPESKAIVASAQQFQVNQHWLRVPSLSGKLSRQEIQDSITPRHPVDDSIPLIALMCRLAAQSGRHSLLHGCSGDCVLWAPDEYLTDIALRGEGWRAAWHEAALAARHHTYLQPSSPMRLLARSLLHRKTPPWLKNLWRLRKRHPYQPVSEALLPEESPAQQIARYAWRHRQQVLKEELAAWLGAWDSEYLQMIDPVGVVRGLEGYERVAGRYGVELADPYADPRVVQFVRSLQPWQKTAGGWTKAPARDWVAGHLMPHRAIYRSDKTHLGGYFESSYLQSRQGFTQAIFCYSPT